MISAVVLASKNAPRPEAQDSFLPLHGKPALQWILESALAAKVAEVICVTDDLTAARREIKLADDRLFWHWAPASRARSASVIAGLWASHPQSDGVMFFSSDQPMIRKELIDSLIAKFEQGAASIVAASIAGQPRKPILLRRKLFPELLKLTGDDGVSSLIPKHPPDTALVDWRDEAPNQDGERQRAAERIKERV